jgi:hypothetical protein
MLKTAASGRLQLWQYGSCRFGQVLIKDWSIVGGTAG